MVARISFGRVKPFRPKQPHATLFFMAIKQLTARLVAQVHLHVWRNGMQKVN